MTNDDLDRLVERALAQREMTTPPQLDHLWRGVQDRRALAARRRRQWSSGLITLAASVLIVAAFYAGRRDESRRHAATDQRTMQLMLEHIRRADALISTFRVAAPTGRWDQSYRAYAMDLVALGRGLDHAAPAADSSLADLMRDVDFVLFQIATYHATRGATDRDLDFINRALHERRVVGRLRSVAATVPSAGELP